MVYLISLTIGVLIFTGVGGGCGNRNPKKEWLYRHYCNTLQLSWGSLTRVCLKYSKRITENKYKHRNAPRSSCTEYAQRKR